LTTHITRSYNLIALKNQSCYVLETYVILNNVKRWSPLACLNVKSFWQKLNGNMVQSYVETSYWHIT